MGWGSNPRDIGSDRDEKSVYGWSLMSSITLGYRGGDGLAPFTLQERFWREAQK